MKVNFKNNQTIMAMINDAPYYRKLKKTFFRKAHPSEIGKVLTTYVKNPNGDGYRKEAEIVIDGTRAIARNNLILGYVDGKPLYNEWTKPFSEIKESYGQDCIDTIDFEYKEYQQTTPIRLLKLTPEVMTILGQEGKDKLLIDVTWSDEPMVALLGDYLAANGYSISQVDIMMQYQEVK